LGKEIDIGLIAIVNHNFKQVYETCNYCGHPGSFSVTLSTSRILTNPFETVITGIGQDMSKPIIAHRYISRKEMRYIKFDLELSLDNDKYAEILDAYPNDESFYAHSWKISRIVIVKADHVATPSYSYKAKFTTKLIDPSIINWKYNGNRSNIQMPPYTEYTYEFQTLRQSDKDVLQLIYARHGHVRPILFIANPVDIKTDTENHPQSDTENDIEAIYGYFNNHIIINNLVNRYISVELSITGARCLKWT
jgi:hypothetical protein